MKRLYLRTIKLFTDRRAWVRQIAILQQELTDALTDLIREAQERGFYKKNLDPKAIAVFIQAYTLGKVIDDVSAAPVDPELYAELINTIIENVFIEAQ